MALFSACPDLASAGRGAAAVRLLDVVPENRWDRPLDPSPGLGTSFTRDRLVFASLRLTQPLVPQTRDRDRSRFSLGRELQGPENRWDRLFSAENTGQ